MKLLSIDGMPVLDAKRPVILNIVTNDVKKANRKEPADCVIARACRRSFRVPEVRVHMSRIYLKRQGHWTRYETPQPLKMELVAFDRGGRFLAGKFTLKPVRPSLRKARGRRTGSSNDAGKGGKQRIMHVMQDVRSGPAPKATAVGTPRG